MVHDELFSIVIPVYNREKTIIRTVESVFKQTYQHFEIIIVDDGSTDKTYSSLKHFLKDERVSYYYQTNAGAQVARNNGLEKARGEYIIFLDSDDVLLPKCLELMVNKYKMDDFGAVYCLTGILNQNGDVVLARNDKLEGWIYKDVLEQGYLTSSSFISMKRNIFSKIGNWDTTFPASQDDDICFRIAKNYKVGLIHSIQGVYYTDAGKGKQIGSSPIRVAKGWMRLWNKYENDVYNVCGNDIIANHYYECLKRFSILNDLDKLYECKEKLKQYRCKKYIVLMSLFYIIKGKFMKWKQKKENQ